MSSKVLILVPSPTRATTHLWFEGTKCLNFSICFHREESVGLMVASLRFWLRWYLWARTLHHRWSGEVRNLQTKWERAALFWIPRSLMPNPPFYNGFGNNNPFQRDIPTMVSWAIPKKTSLVLDNFSNMSLVRFIGLIQYWGFYLQLIGICLVISPCCYELCHA